MIWATIFLLIVSIFVAFKLVGLTNNNARLKYLGLAIAAVTLSIMQLSAFLNYFIVDDGFSIASDFIIEWGHLISLAFVLSSLAIFIRESKPVFAQFPMIYTAFPLLIVFSYILIQDTYALKTWLITIYQGGAILVALLMYSVYTYRRNEFVYIFAGSILFLITYILFWNISGMRDSHAWIWKLLTGLAMLVSIFGYEYAENPSSVNSTQ